MKKSILSLLSVGAITLAAVLLRPMPVFTQAAGQIGNPVNVPGIDKPVRVIRGRFTSDVSLTADTHWVLRGAVFIGAADGTSPARLTIAAGTRIIGETATRGSLVIERGAQIIANGTAAAPIVMTSDQPVGRRFRGDWGGLIINGNAPLNLPGGQAIGEGATGIYGGTNPTDNSGVLRYVRVEFAGIEFSPDNELNGIAFQGVGSGTTVENIQIHYNKDDGIEMFGGTVNIKRVLLTNIGDDSIDWTWGWTGKLQFAIAQQRGDDTDQGIDIRDASTTPQIGTTFQVTNGILWQNGRGPNGTNASVNWATSATTVPMRTFAGTTVTEEDPMLVAAFNRTAPDWRPLPGSPALVRTPAVPPNDGFFEVANYLGALGPDLATDWTRGWTFYGR